MSDRDLAISVRGLSKSYTIAHNAPKHTTLGEAIAHTFKKNGRARPEAETFWALRDVEFDVKKGDVVGIIGRNGAGKSTLLKILSRITEPTTGQIDVYGRIGSLLEVGTGFHPELTGRENIFMNGSILGMSRQEIAKSFDAIVDFSGTEQFLDTPVKRYSSGMYVRLAFAVAAHLNPEILIVDEVLAVGDAEFQKKCLGKMQDVASQGRTILFVSHNMTAISGLCKTGIYLAKGKVADVGTIKDVVSSYMNEAASENPDRLFNDKSRTGSGLVQISNVQVVSGETDDAAVCGSEMSISLSFKSQQDGLPIQFLVGVYDNFNSRVLFLDSSVVADLPETFPMSGRLVLSFPETFSLYPGRYSINVATYVHREIVDYIPGALVFDVQNGDFFGTGRLPTSSAAVLYKNKWSFLPDRTQI